MSPDARLRRTRRVAQSTVEYVLVISVIVVALWAAAQVLVPGLQDGAEAMTGDVRRMATQGYVDGGS